jgi:hypothetical protein
MQMKTPLRAGIAPGLAWVVGTVFFFHRMLFSGFREVAGGFGDTRLCNYFLEHSFRWLARRATHESLWDLPVFHPAPNTFAYSETLLGAAPIYWLWRLPGLAPDSAFQMWMLTAASLNFLSAYLMTRRGFGFERAPSALGGFLCAYGNIRAAQLHHPQLIPQFFTFLGIWLLCRVLREPERRQPAAVLAFFGCLVGQIYASFYLGWFFALGLAVAGLWGLILPGSRGRVLGALRSNLLGIALSGLVALTALLPLALHGLEVARQTGWRDYDEAASMVPRPQSWIYMGRRSLLYFWLRDAPVFVAIPAEHEQRLGLGIVCTLAAAVGLWKSREKPWGTVLIASAVTVVLLSTTFGGFSLWRAVHAYFPGGAAIRAVSRIGLLLLIPAGLGLAAFHERFGSRRIVAALLAVCLLEQVYSVETYPKALGRSVAATIARQVGPGCPSYYLSVLPKEGSDRSDWLHQVDAMTAQLIVEIPTVNGYSGNYPSGYGSLDQNVVETPEDRLRIRRDLASWTRRNRLDGVCLVETVSPY